MGTNWKREDDRATYSSNPAVESRVPSNHANLEGALVAGAVAGGLIAAIGAGVLAAIFGAILGALVGAITERVMHSALHDPGSRGQDIYNAGVGRDEDDPARMQLPTDRQPDEFVDSSSFNQPGDQSDPPVRPETRRS